MDAIFPRHEREIFAYWNGVKDVKGDPLAIESRLMRALAEEDMEALGAQLKNDSLLVVMDATDKLLPAVRSAFKVAELDEDTGEGLTQGETINLFVEFLEWKSDLKAGSGPGASIAPLTAGGPADASTTKSSSESSGTSPEPARRKRSRPSKALIPHSPDDPTSP